MAGASPLREIGAVQVVSSANSILYLGGVPFGPLEHPDNLKFAISQSLAKKTKIGGSRYIQPLGPQYEDISWTGRLYNDQSAGFTVAGRIKTWRRMAVDGQSRVLRWRGERYNVIVEMFTWTYLHKNRADYEIKVVVVSEATGATSQTQAPSLDNQVSGLVDRGSQQLAAITAVDPNAPLTASYSIMKNTIAGSGPLAATAGTSAPIILASVQTALSTVQKYAANIGVLFPRSHIINVASLADTLSLTAKNIAQGQTARTVRVFGGTIEDVAMREYGTLSVARQLQRANNLSSNRLPIGVASDIALPPYP